MGAPLGQRLQAQTARRDQLPEHYSTGAIEAAIATTREVLERRAWTFRNLARMDLLLELVRLRINRFDDPRAYASELRRRAAPPHRDHSRERE